MRRSRVTASDVAVKAGVSQTTVSVVLSGRDGNGIPEDTRKRVRDAATILGYRPHGLARALARGRTDVFGIVLFHEAPTTDADSYFLRTMLNRLLHNVLGSKRNPLLFASLPYDPLDPYLLNDGRADGFILISPDIDDPVIAFLENQRIPFVSIGTRGDFRAGAWVDVDNEIGVAAAVGRLADAGHRHIAHLSGPHGNWDAEMRQEAFLREMASRCLPVPEGFIACGAFIADEAETVALELLSRPNRPTAIFAGNDNMAIGAYRAARRLNLRLPEDVSIIGFDDIEQAAALSPPLTTLAQPVAEMAESAVTLLTRIAAFPANGEDFSGLRSAVFAPSLVERGSVALISSNVSEEILTRR